MSTVLDLPKSEPLPAEVLENEDLFEIVDGVRVELSPMSADSQVLTSELARRLGNYGIEKSLGIAAVEVLIKLPSSVDRNRRPDAIFIPYSRWPKNKRKPRTNAWEVLPSLCVEVVSPTDLAEEIMVKLGEYQRAGVEQVWVVYPEQALVCVYLSPRECRILSREDVLEGGTVLPGFSLPLADLFPTES